MFPANLLFNPTQISNDERFYPKENHLELENLGHGEPSGNIDNMFTELINNEAARLRENVRSDPAQPQETEKENLNPESRGVRNVMLSQALAQDEARLELNYFHNKQWQGQYFNPTNKSPDFRSFLEDPHYKEDQDELDSRGLIESYKSSLVKSHEDSSSVIQFHPPLTSTTTALPSLSISELTLINDSTKELDAIEKSETTILAQCKQEETETLIDEPNQPPSPLLTSPKAQRPNYDLRPSSENGESDQRGFVVGNNVGRDSSAVIQFQPPLTSTTTALPPLSTSELTLINDSTKELDAIEKSETPILAQYKQETETLIDEPQSPLLTLAQSQRQRYYLRPSNHIEKYDPRGSEVADNLGRGRGMGRGRGRGGGRKRKLDFIEAVGSDRSELDIIFESFVISTNIFPLQV